MASMNVAAPFSGTKKPRGPSNAVEKLPQEMKELKIRDDKVDA